MLGVLLPTVLEHTRLSLRTKMESECVNCSLRAIWLHSTPSFLGRLARLDFICASAELLTDTSWAGVRRDIDVRVGSAEDHWPVGG